MTNKESIEIPLGAKDSEFKGWECTIPDGMEARIDGNKIIVEPKESEDERIRKSMINYFKSLLVESSKQEFNDFINKEFKEYINWLEKQGEKNELRKIEPKFKVGDTIRPKGFYAEFKITGISISEGYYKGKGWSLDIIAADDDYELVEQNPADKVEPKFKVGDVIRNKWSNRTKTIIAIDDYQYTIDDGMPAQPFKVNINEQDNWELVEQNPAWSEEDERSIRDSIFYLESAKKYFEKDDNILWDEKWFNSCVDWLKSLKERYTWKPSDEQLEALEHSLGDYNIRIFEDRFEVLTSLYNDLKKLKG